MNITSFAGSRLGFGSSSQNISSAGASQGQAPISSETAQKTGGQTPNIGIELAKG